MCSEPSTHLAPKLEIPYSSTHLARSGLLGIKWQWFQSFMRVPTEPGSNDLRIAGPRATHPSSQHTALNPCPSNASLKQKSLQVRRHGPFQRLSLLFKDQKPDAGHVLVGSGQSWVG